jgi:hypothetical protein
MDRSEEARSVRQQIINLSIVGLMIWMVGGCATSVEVATREPFYTYNRVAMVSNLSRQQEELFIPIYMKAFPHQSVVERRDLAAVVGEQDLLPERLDEQTRAKLKQLLGVEALVVPSFTPKTEQGRSQLSLKVVDTESGEVTAAVLVTEAKPFMSKPADDRGMIRKAVATLKAQ